MGEPHAPVGDGPGGEAFKDALARWASTVTVVAARDPDDGRVRATTVTSFAPVSVDPAEVAVSLNANAVVLPFVTVGRDLGITLLAEDQRRWARVFADPFPAGQSPWPEDGVPLIPGGVVGLACAVQAIHATDGGSRLVVARVREVVAGTSSRPLLYWARAYRRLEEEL
jgi:flavin reductase (NADH)